MNINTHYCHPSYNSNQCFLCQSQSHCLHQMKLTAMKPLLPCITNDTKLNYSTELLLLNVHMAIHTNYYTMQSITITGG